MSESANPDDVVRTKRLEVVDEKDRVRAVVGNVSRHATETYLPGVSLRDAHGRERARLAIHDTGVQLALMLEGNEVLVAGVADHDPENTEAGAFLVLCDRDGAPAMEWRATADGSRAWSPEA